MEKNILEKVLRDAWGYQLIELKKYGVKCIRSDWTPAKTSRDGFLQEYQRMMNAQFNPSKNALKCKNSADMEFYNIINSPGLKIWLGLKWWEEEKYG